MADILSPTGMELPEGGEQHSRALINRNFTRSNDIAVGLATPYSPAALTLATGYVARGSGFESPQVWKDSHGVCHLEGSVTNQNTITWTANTSYDFATLPVGFDIELNAVIEQRISMRIGNTLIDGMISIIKVGTDTKVRMSLAATQTGIAALGATIHLNGIRWRAG